MQKYYEAPSNEIFNEIKEQAISIWKEYDDTYGYATDKVNRIKDLENISDNAMTIVAMFDIHNQSKLFNRISNEACKEIDIRIASVNEGATEITEQLPSAITVADFTTHLINYVKDKPEETIENVEAGQFRDEVRDEYIERKSIYLLAHAGLKLMDLTDEDRGHFFSMLNSVYDDGYQDGIDSTKTECQVSEWSEEYTGRTGDEVSTLEEIKNKNIIN